jgi:uncharacterized RDD family membrane protein YckC
MDHFRIFSLVVLALGIAVVRYGRRDPTRPYDTFGARFFAAWLDGFVMWPFNSINAWTIGAGVPRVPLAGWFIFYSFVYFSYQMFCHARWGQTLGKWVFGVRVLDVSEIPLRPVQAVKRDAIALMLTAALVIQQLIRGRYSLEDPKMGDVLSILSTAWGGLEIVTMLTNRKRRALHDIIAGSVVVRVAPMRRRKAVEQAVAADAVAAEKLE